jgi:hypothetical protein
VKIQPKDVNTYREIRKKLDHLGAEYNTFQLKEGRKFRVAIRHLHPSTSPEAIAKKLEMMGHKVSQLPFNMKHRSSKELLPLFFCGSKSKEKIIRKYTKCTR